MTMGTTMTLDRNADRNTDRAVDLDTVWADVGTSIERFVRRRINDPHHADEIVAEVMLRIHQNLDALDDHERVTAWVFRITRNAITDHYRRAGRRREVLVAEIEPDVDLSADAWLDDQEATLTELASCIEGVSVSGMKSRVQRGRRQFATLVRQCCDVTTDNRGELVDFSLRPDGCGCPPADS